MGASGTSTRRVIAVITLMLLAVWALRGYVPGVDRTVDRMEPQRSNPAALAAVVVLLCAAVAIIGFAIVVKMKDRRPRPPSMGELPRSGGPADRPSWRFVVVAFVAVIALLALIALLSRVPDPGPVEAPGPTANSEPAVDDGATPSAPPSHDDDAGRNVVNYLIPPVLILMALIVVGTAVASRRHARVPIPAAAVSLRDEPGTPAGATSLARAAEIGLAEIGDLSREPRQAIIACYAAMERELTRVPGAAPQAYDTPTEVLTRAVDSGALRADSATELVDLFEEARFSPHVMSEAHRDAAVQILNRVLTELPQRLTAGVS